MTYAKIEGGKLRVLRGVPNVSNPKPETLTAYAAAHGYKPYYPSPAPEDGGYYHHGYRETAKQIRDVYTPLSDVEAAPLKIADLKQKLFETDYVAAKLAEAEGIERESLTDAYSDVLAQRKEWRKQINIQQQLIG